MVNCVGKIGPNAHFALKMAFDSVDLAAEVCLKFKMAEANSHGFKSSTRNKTVLILKKTKFGPNLVRVDALMSSVLQVPDLKSRLYALSLFKRNVLISINPPEVFHRFFFKGRNKSNRCTRRPVEKT